MAKTILNFHFDYRQPSLRQEQGGKSGPLRRMQEMQVGLIAAFAFFLSVCLPTHELVDLNKNIQKRHTLFIDNGQDYLFR